jgi:hypothetical protein
MLYESKRTVFGLVVISLLFLSSARAQTVTGTMSGTVTDAARAVIPNAAVTARNSETGLVRTVSTNGEGHYAMPFLPLGSYDVTVEVAGFQKFEKSGVLVELNKITITDFALEISQVEAKISVTSETPQIETTTGEIKHSLSEMAVVNTPLAGRNFLALAEQIPGYQNAPFIGSANVPTNSVGSSAVFSGQGTRSATFQVDGINNDDSSENQNRQGVNVSTIKEFQVLTNAYSAEFGRAGGAVILIQTKSGTNKYHGDVYDFIQNDKFNANDFFANRAGTSAATGRPISPRPPVRRNQYGWTFGGPVMFPIFGEGGKTYWSGRNRLFFFTSGERIISKDSASRTSFIFLPGEEVRACRDAAEAAAVKPGGKICVDPATHPNLEADLKFLRSIQSLYDSEELRGVTPNDPVACADMIASGRGNRCVTKLVQNSSPISDYTGRLDFTIDPQNSLTVRYQYSRQIFKTGRLIKGDNFGTQNNRQYNTGLTFTHVFNTRQVGEFRYGFGNRATLQDVVDGNDIPTLRYNTSLCTGSFCNGTIIGTSTNVPINRRQHDHQFVYNHTYTLDKHTLKFGIDQRFQSLDDLTLSALRGFWTFGVLPGVTLADVRNKAPLGFTGWENFLRGVTTGYQKGYGPALAENRFNETNLYLEDKYNLRRNVTLHLGARYEYVAAPKENQNRFSYGYGADKDNIEPRVGFAWSPSFENGFLHRISGEPGQSVVRGGYGIYHSRLFQSLFSQSGLSLRAQPPNGFFQAFGAGAVPCPNNVADPTCGFVFTPGAAARSSAFTANGVRDIGGRLQTSLLVPDPHLQMPYVQQWNLTLERELPGQIALQVGYDGNRGIGLPFFDTTVNASAFPIVSPSLLADIGGGNLQPVVFDRACTPDVIDPICTSGVATSFSALSSTTATLAQKGILVTGGVPHGYISLNTLRLEERRPDPSRSSVFNLRNFSWTYYNSLVVKATKRLSRGLIFTTTYTWSKAIDTGSEATFTGTDVNQPSGKKGGAAESLRGLSAFHASHRFVASYSYLLPIFRSQTGTVGRILGGWNISGVTILQSGNPFTILAGYDVNGDGLGGDRPRLSDLSLLGASVDNGRQLPGGSAVSTISETQLPGASFVPAQGAPVAGRIFLPGTSGDGTIGRNTFFGHGINNTDIAAYKEFKLHENVKFIVRMEFFNVFNRVTFDIPSSRSISDASAPLGRITAQRNISGFFGSGRVSGARSGQLALRLVF